jgi:hypothetical protein
LLSEKGQNQKSQALEGVESTATLTQKKGKAGKKGK